MTTLLIASWIRENHGLVLETKLNSNSWISQIGWETDHVSRFAHNVSVARFTYVAAAIQKSCLCAGNR